MLGLGLGAAPASAAALQGDQEIAALNGQRAMNGIPGDIVENIDWSLGCAKHMAWVKLNFLDHVEPVGTPGYSPEGDAAGQTAVLTGSGSSFFADGRNDFQHAPIHLMQMLNPLLKTSGAADGCLATLRDVDRQFAQISTFSYPGDGGVALTSETAFEGPFVPGDFVGLPMGTTTGPHLFFYAFKPGANAAWFSKGQITAATLTGPGGAPVPFQKVDNHTTEGGARNLGIYLSPGGILIPVSPLTAGATYTASVNFTFDSGGTASRTWSFTASPTLPLPAVPAPSRAPLGFVPAPVPTPTPAPPTPTPVPTPGPGTSVDTSPVTITELKLKARSLAFKASRDAPLWVTIERKKVTGKGKKRQTKYSLKDSLSVQGKAGAVVTVSHKKLVKGSYRVTFLRGGAKGARQLTKTVTVK